MNQDCEVMVLKEGFFTIIATATDASGVSATCSVTGTVDLNNVMEETSEDNHINQRDEQT